MRSRKFYQYPLNPVPVPTHWDGIFFVLRLCSSKFERLTILLSRGNIYEFNGLVVVITNYLLDLFQCDGEKFTALVNKI